MILFDGAFACNNAPYNSYLLIEEMASMRDLEGATFGAWFVSIPKSYSPNAVPLRTIAGIETGFLGKEYNVECLLRSQKPGFYIHLLQNGNDRPLNSTIQPQNRNDRPLNSKF
jgi:hypothetical protein